jgi:hypothetical protein
MIRLSASCVRPRQLAAWAAFAICTSGAPSLAQPVRATLATAVVVDAALTGAAVQNLEFRSMSPGGSKPVAPQDAQTCADGCMAGKWRFQNLSRKGADRRANLQFTALPDSLAGPGGAKLGVTYTSRACVHDRATNAQMGCVTQGATVQGTTVVVPLNKVAGAIGDTSPPTARDLFLWIGGTAVPRPGQRAGDYSGVITVFFFYN